MTIQLIIGSATYDVTSLAFWLGALLFVVFPMLANALPGFLRKRGWVAAANIVEYLGPLALTGLRRFYAGKLDVLISEEGAKALVEAASKETKQ